jgi:hypothetical protein
MNRDAAISIVPASCWYTSGEGAAASGCLFSFFLQIIITKLIVLPCSNFAANLTDTLGDASFTGYSHSGAFFYNLTSTALTNKTITSAKLVIDPLGSDITVVPLQGPFPPTSTSILVAEEGEEAIDPPVYGSFSPEDISPEAVAAFATQFGGVYDVLQVACKGDLYVVLETKNGARSITAPVNFVPSVHSPDKTCEASAVPYVPAMAPAASGATTTTATGVVLILAMFNFLY